MSRASKLALPHAIAHSAVRPTRLPPAVELVFQTGLEGVVALQEFVVPLAERLQIPPLACLCPQRLANFAERR